jgi:hypothetical protein
MLSGVEVRSMARLHTSSPWSAQSAGSTGSGHAPRATNFNIVACASPLSAPEGRQLLAQGVNPGFKQPMVFKALEGRQIPLSPPANVLLLSLPQIAIPHRSA